MKKRIIKFRIPVSFIMTFIITFSLLSLGVDKPLKVYADEKEVFKIAKVENTDIKVGSKSQLQTTGVDGKSIKWTTSDDKVVKVDGTGKIVAMTAGTAVITAQLEDNNKVKDEITFNVQENKVKVFMRIEGYDHTILPRQEVEVSLKDIASYFGQDSTYSWGAEMFDKPTLAHAVVETVSEKGLKIGKKVADDLVNNGKGKYEFNAYGKSISPYMIDGDQEGDYGAGSTWAFKIDDKNISYGCADIGLKGGEDIVLYYHVGHKKGTSYTKMDLDKTDVKTGEKVKIKINGSLPYDDKFKPLVGVTILVNGEAYKDIKTDDKGEAVLEFGKSGEYIISATREASKKINRKPVSLIDIVRPIPITVNVEQGDTPVPPEETKVSVTDVKLNTNSCELKEGETTQLIGGVLPENATNKKITWKSNDEKIAKIDENGKVTAVSEGQVTITVTSEDGNKTATCSIKVVKSPEKPSEKALKIENITTTGVYDRPSDSIKYVKVTEFRWQQWGYVTIKATNTCDEDKDIVLTVGLFDSQGKLVKYVSNIDKIKAGEEIELQGKINISDLKSEGYVIRGFVWDGLDSMNPLIDVIEYPIYLR